MRGGLRFERNRVARLGNAMRRASTRIDRKNFTVLRKVGYDDVD
jgi:hypothetical protein